MNDASDMFVPQGKEKPKGNTFAYIVLAVGVATIIAHYTLVLPWLKAHGI